MTETLPRRVRISRYYIVRVISSFAMAVFVLCLVIVHESNNRGLKLTLLDHGQPARATITAIDRRGDSGIVRFKYPVDGKTFEDKRQLKLNEIPQIKLGDEVDIVYLVQDPQSNWFGPGLSREALRNSLRDAFVASGGGFLLFTVLGLRDLWTIRKHAWFARYGTPGYATLRATSGIAAQDGIVYDFITTDGRTITGKARLGVPTIRTLELGAVTEVLYDPARPERNVLGFTMRAARIV